MKKPQAWLAILALCAFSLWVACSPRDDAGDNSGPTASASPSETAEPTSTPATTPVPGDVPAPLAGLLSQVAAERGLEAPPSLNAEVIARADLPALIEEITTAEDRQSYREITTLYRLLGFFAPNQDYEGIFDSFGSDAILGLYSPVHDTLWVVSESGSLDDLTTRERQTLIHELVHVLQDYHFDLEAGYEEVSGNLDRELAWTATTEGDAEIFETEFGGGGGAIRAGSAVLFMRGDPRQVGNVPPAFIREMFFPYQFGVIFARAVREDHGVERLNDFIENPPLATSLILHPERVDSGWSPQPVTLPNIGGAMGQGWQRESGGTLGEFRWSNYLQMELNGVSSQEAADGWIGDEYAVYTNGSGSAAVFRILFNSNEEADAFREALADFMAASGAELSARDGMAIAERDTGFVTVGLQSDGGAEVVLATGSNLDIALLAMGSLANS